MQQECNSLIFAGFRWRRLARICFGIASVILFQMRTSKIPNVCRGGGISGWGSGVSDACTALRAPGIKELSRPSLPITLNSAWSGRTPNPATLGLGPFGIARRKHLLFNILLVFVLLCIVDPFLDLFVVLCLLPLLVVKFANNFANVNVVLMVKLDPFFQSEIILVRQSSDVINQSGFVELSGDKSTTSVSIQLVSTKS